MPIREQRQAAQATLSTLRPSPFIIEVLYPMPLVILLLLLALIAGCFSVLKSWRKAKSKGEKSILTRITLFSLFGILFIAALLCRLPLKFLLLAMSPLFFVLVIANQVFDRAKQRVKKTPPPDIERMKRLN